MIHWDRQLGGAAGVEVTGVPLPEKTLASIQRTRLALKGPLTTPVGSGFRSANVALPQGIRAPSPNVASPPRQLFPVDATTGSTSFSYARISKDSTSGRNAGWRRMVKRARPGRRPWRW